MEGARQGGVGRRDAGGRLRRLRRRAQVRRPGFWISLHEEDQGAVVQEGVDFVQDSELDGADDYLFISDSEEEACEDGDGYNHVSSPQPVGDAVAGAPLPVGDGNCSSAWFINVANIAYCLC